MNTIIKTTDLTKVYDQSEVIKNVNVTIKSGEIYGLLGLNGAGKKKVSQFSLGMRQRLAIARAIMTQPELLILDEPINGLDPDGINDIRQLLKQLSIENHTSILISSHILSEVEHIADTIGVLHN